jgi:hypothetical protein
MDIPRQSIKIDINDRKAQTIQAICNTKDSGTRFVDVYLYANSQVIDITGNSATATFVIDGFLVAENVSCDVENNCVKVAIDSAEIQKRSGIMLVEIQIKDENENVLTTPIAFKVRVTSSISDNAYITENSLGTTAEILEEVAAARGTYNSLLEHINSKADNATSADRSTIADLAQYGYFADSKAQDAFDKIYPSEEKVSNIITDADYIKVGDTRPTIIIAIEGDKWENVKNIAISVTNIKMSAISDTATEKATLRIRFAKSDSIDGKYLTKDCTQDATLKERWEVDLSSSDYSTAKYILFYPTQNMKDTKNGYVSCHIRIENLDIDTSSSSGVKVDCTTIPKIVNQLSDTTSIEALNDNPNITNNLNQLTMGHCESWQKTDSQEDILTLLHFTDIHNNSVNAKRISDFYADYADYIDSAICTGDMVGSQFDDNYDFWGNCGCGRIMVTLGNHDVFTKNTYEGNEPAWNGATTYIVPQKMCYDKFIAPFVSDWHVTQPDGVDVNNSKHYGACYYFKDYADYKVRLFALDCMHFSDAQVEWFKTELDNAKSLGYGVVCGYHYPLGKTDSIGTTWCVPRPYERQTPTTAKAVGIVSEFIDNGGEFICWLSGHYHQDAVGVLTDDNRQLDINLDCASCSGITTESMPVVGTKSQDCFTIIGFDTTAKYIKMYRVGRDTNRYMQKHEVFCWDYANGKLIYDNNVNNIDDKINNALSSKADKATTLEGYGITDGLSNTAGAVDTDNIADKSITLEKLKDDFYIDREHIDDNAVGSDEIATEQIAKAHLTLALQNEINGKYDSSNVESGVGVFSYDENITTLSTNEFAYQRVGDFCFVQLKISTSTAVAANKLTLSGLPYVSKYSGIRQLFVTSGYQNKYAVTAYNSSNIKIASSLEAGDSITAAFVYKIA